MGMPSGYGQTCARFPQARWNERRLKESSLHVVKQEPQQNKTSGNTEQPCSHVFHKLPPVSVLQFDRPSSETETEHVGDRIAELPKHGNQKIAIEELQRWPEDSQGHEGA